MALALTQRFECELHHVNALPQVPSALLTFSWDSAVLADIKAAGAEPDSSILKPELLVAIEKLP